jgi:hypothetical protein
MAEVKNYKRKPTVVQAIQFTGNNFDELKNFSPIVIDEQLTFSLKEDEKDKPLICLPIDTAEGRTILREGDFLVKGIDNGIYPCNQQIFSLIYEETNLPYKIDERFIKKAPVDDHK